jgi:hypothetical protein
MRADNTANLITAASQRHELTRSEAIRAIRELDAAGTAVTFESVARAARVSRSWLYTQPDIRAEIQRLRDLGRRAPSTPVPAYHRSSDASLLRRLEAVNTCMSVVKWFGPTDRRGFWPRLGNPWF